MVFDVSVAMTWILFLALFPIAFFWLRRAWRIFARRDYSEVALRRGEPPSDPAKFAPYAGAINLIGGLAIVYVVFGVVAVALPFDRWSAMAGLTIWGKFIADFILGRHAHLLAAGKKR